MAVKVKSPDEIATMKQAGYITACVLRRVAEEVRPGLRTIELDRVCEKEVARYGARASFKGYRGYPATLCVSINDEVVHGIPGERMLKEGDIVSLDFGATFNGMQGDSAITVGVGAISPQARKLIEVTEGALMAGIKAARHGVRMGDVSSAIQKYAESRGFSVVREYSGHGIGYELHEEPQVPNFGRPGQGLMLTKGMTLAVEPMVNCGGWQTEVQDNEWTVVTLDGALSAHFEHTIVIQDAGAEILTCCP